MGRPETRELIDDFRELPAHSIVREARAAGRRRGEVRWRWTVTGQVAAWALYVLELGPESGRMHLEHIGGSQILALVASRPRFGGLRWWFSCPGCGRRVARLYQALSGGPFQCRHCRNLTYASRRRSGLLERLALKAERLNELAGPHAGEG